jgi:hypothetical protein
MKHRLLTKMLVPLLLAAVSSTTLLAAAPRQKSAKAPKAEPQPVETTPRVPIPAATNILAHLNPHHPRLLATAETFAQLKQQTASAPQLRKWHDRLQAEAREMLTAAPSRYEIPDGLRLLATSRRVLDRVYTLGLLYQLDGDRRYAERAWQELQTAADFKDWNTRHFLDTAEMTHAFAIGYDWLYDVWTPEQRATLRQAMVEKGLRPALKIYQNREWWAKARHNWNQVCNGGIGMGALALAEAEPQLAGEILHDALESVQIPMAEFAPDGAWKEGPGYWNYATSYNVVLLAGLQTALGTDFGLSQLPAFKDTGLFPVYLCGPLGRTFNYADGGDHMLRAPQMFWLAREFKQPVFAWYESQAAAPAPLDLLWFDSAGLSPKAAGLPLDKLFRGAEVAVLRSAWEDPRAVFVAFKAGDNKANHSHLDLGSFVFDAAGVRWAMDLGSDNYNLPGYFAAQRWTYYRLRAEGQNTLVINPTESPDQDPVAATRIARFESTPQKAFAIADLTPAYAGRATRVWRGMALLDRSQVLVQDEVQAKTPAELWWFMHTPTSVEIDSDGRSARLKQATAQLEARILSPAGARFQLMDAHPLPTSPHPTGQATNERVRKLAIHLTDISDTRLSVLLVPKPASQEAVIPPVTLSPLSDW